MNIYEKIQKVKEEFLAKNIKKSGQNKFAGFSYYELSDITPPLIELCNKYKLFTAFRFTNEEAVLEIVNVEEPKEVQLYSSPMEELELKGCNKIQALGGTETYQRRYLYMAAFDIIEADLFDKTSGISDEKLITKTQIKKIGELVEDIPAMLNYYKLEKIEDMTYIIAEQIIERKSNAIK
jgi:hypothetical protein